MLKLSSTHGPSIKVHFLKITIKHLNVPDQNTNIFFLLHIFGLNVCVHPWICSAGDILARRNDFGLKFPLGH